MALLLAASSRAQTLIFPRILYSFNLLGSIGDTILELHSPNLLPDNIGELTIECLLPLSLSSVNFRRWGFCFGTG